MNPDNLHEARRFGSAMLWPLGVLVIVLAMVVA